MVKKHVFHVRSFDMNVNVVSGRIDIGDAGSLTTPRVITPLNCCCSVTCVLGLVDISNFTCPVKLLHLCSRRHDIIIL